MIRKISVSLLSALMLTVLANSTAWADIDVMPLDSYDFTVTAGDPSSISYLAPYNYSLEDWLYATSPSGGVRSFWYDASTDPSREDVLTTARGIELGDSITEVANAYGPALLDTDPSNDALFLSAVNSGWNNVANMFRSQIRSSVSYLYRYQPKWHVGEITFYFDRDENVILISYAAGSWPNPTFLNNASICRAVQKELNAEGYSCGSVDGSYGPATRNAIMAFQEDLDLDPNGVIDYALMQELLGEDKVGNLLWELDVVYGNDYGFDSSSDWGGTWDEIYQSVEDNTGDTHDTWDIHNQS